MTDEPSDVYARLSEQFDNHYTDPRGFTYISGEQVVSRLNDVLGIANWDYKVLEHGVRDDADEVWVLGELTARIDGQTVVRQQFGSDKIQRSRQKANSQTGEVYDEGGGVLDYGFDLKGASTDCLKKAASLFGVGLYLYKRGNPTLVNVAPRRAQSPVQPRQRTVADDPKLLPCGDCGQPLKEVKFKDGTVWSPLDLAQRGVDKFGVQCCMDCYRKRNSQVAVTS